MRRPLLISVAGWLLATAPVQGQAKSGPDFVYLMTTSALFDSNLDHDESPVGAYGGVFGMGIEFRNRRDQPTFEFAYGLAGHRYSIAAPWNRISHGGTIGVTLRPSGRLAVATALEATFRGSSEDRDLSDQFKASQGLAWRFLRRTKLEVLGAARIRRFPTTSERDARNLYAEAELTQGLSRSVDWSGGFRLERNDADSNRYSYVRETISSELEIDGGTMRLAIEGKFRRQQYLARLANPEVPTALRLDHRLQIGLDWTVVPRGGFDITLSYGFERRLSNEAEKGFLAHQIGLSLTRRW